MISIPTAPVASEEKVSRSSYLYPKEQVYFWFLVRLLCGAQRHSAPSQLCRSLTAAVVLCMGVGLPVSPLPVAGREKVAGSIKNSMSSSLPDTESSVSPRGARWSLPRASTDSRQRPESHSCRVQGRGVFRERRGQPAAPHGC